jgi:hypothetical protein
MNGEDAEHGEDRPERALPLLLVLRDLSVLLCASAVKG